MVLPIGQITVSEEIEIIEEATLPTKTYKLDLVNGRCTGLTDGMEAMKQAIYKILSTIRFENIIYSDNYGFESVIGKDQIFVRAELPRRIKETLLQDERITAVEDVDLQFKGDSCTVKFTCITVYGDVTMLEEVITLV